MTETTIPGSRSVLKCDRVLADGFRARRPAFAGWFLAALLLLGFGVDGLATAAEADSFDAVAKGIEGAVLRLGYPKGTAEGLVRLARGWGLETWQRKIAQARAGPSPKSAAEIARIEEEAARALCAKIQAEFRTCIAMEMHRYFHLSAVVEDRKAQCLGYAQLFYVLGSSVGLRVKTMNVLEPAAGVLPPGVGHAACAVDRSDGTCLVVDLPLQFLSRPFVWQDEYLAAGNYWELKPRPNTPGLHGRVQVWDEAGLVAAIYDSFAEGCTKTDRREQAISYLNQAIELNSQYAEAFYNRGNRYAERRQHERAIADYDRAIELDPKCARALTNRGNARLALWQYAAALADYNRAIELSPKDAEAFHNRGVAHARMGQPAEAIAAYNRAIELNPRFGAAYAGRGIAYAEQGKQAEARADLKKALELDHALRELVQSNSDYFRLGL
jgi:tetratricopeptide (TPR) repeat protein